MTREKRGKKQVCIIYIINVHFNSALAISWSFGFRFSCEVWMMHPDVSFLRWTSAHSMKTLCSERPPRPGQGCWCSVSHPRVQVRGAPSQLRTAGLGTPAEMTQHPTEPFCCAANASWIPSQPAVLLGLGISQTQRRQENDLELTASLQTLCRHWLNPLVSTMSIKHS